MKIIYAIFFLLLLTTGNTVMGQLNTITGKVTDAEGEPLQSANVSLTGTGKGAATDIDGNFQIYNVSP